MYPVVVYQFFQPSTSPEPSAKEWWAVARSSVLHSRSGKGALTIWSIVKHGAIVVDGNIPFCRHLYKKVRCEKGRVLSASILRIYHEAWSDASQPSIGMKLIIIWSLPEGLPFTTISHNVPRHCSGYRFNTYMGWWCFIFYKTPVLPL